jgi:beta-glucosidase
MIDALLGAMTLADKAGQMTQLDISMVVHDSDCPVRLDAAKLDDVIGRLRVGSLLNSPFSGGPRCNKTGWTASEWRSVVSQIQAEASRYGVPPLAIGIDSIHGANYVHGATLFPQQLGLAATFDRDLVQRVGLANGKDTRAAGLHWIFSPVLGLGVNPLWSRLYETFGEDPLVASRLGGAMVLGMQTSSADGSVPLRAAATMKHFIGYSAPRIGEDRDGAWLPERVLLQYFVPPFEAAVHAGVAAAMESCARVTRSTLPIAHARRPSGLHMLDDPPDCERCRAAARIHAHCISSCRRS